MGYGEEVAGLWGAWRGRYPGGRAVAVVTLGAVSGLALTWKQLTDFVPNALTGRAWIENLAVAPMVIFGVVIGPAVVWSLTHPEDLPRILAALPFLVAFVSLLKVLVTSWAFREAIRRGLIGATRPVRHPGPLARPRRVRGRPRGADPAGVARRGNEGRRDGRHRLLRAPGPIRPRAPGARLESARLNEDDEGDRIGVEPTATPPSRGRVGRSTIS